MLRIYRCPNCYGQQTVSRPPHIAGDQQEWATANTALYPCPTCDAKGYIAITTEDAAKENE